MDFRKQMDIIHDDFKKCHQSLLAIGDESRQAILITLMYGTGNCDGTRVGDIAAATHLSRPAVSHHLKVLKDAGLVGVRSVGTMNFYYCNLGEQAEKLFTLAHHVEDLKRAALIEYGNVWNDERR